MEKISLHLPHENSYLSVYKLSFNLIHLIKPDFDS